MFFSSQSIAIPKDCDAFFDARKLAITSSQNSNNNYKLIEQTRFNERSIMEIIQKNLIMNLKNISKLLIIATSLILLLSLSSCNKEEMISSSKLPSQITTYISTHFPTHTILQVTKDIDGFIKTYEIILSESVSLEFNRKKEVTEIEGISQLPNSVIPEKIRTYVENNFSDNDIIAWELERNSQQIKLDNGLELEFNMKGDFLRIDG